MKVFISFHRTDTKYKNKIINILKENNIQYFCVSDKENFDGWSHQKIANHICEKMNDCDVLLCLVGKKTYSRPHVDYEIHFALKGGLQSRKGILVVMLENRLDNKNNIDYSTFPTRLKDNMNYIVIEQFASIQDKLLEALNKSMENKKNNKIQISKKSPVMKLRTVKYYDKI